MSLSSRTQGWLEGSVTEVIDAGDYRYLCVSSGRESVWMATTLADVVVGDGVEYQQGLLMNDFESPTLGRTFPQILFVDQIRVKNRAAVPVQREAGLPSGHPVVPRSSRTMQRRLSPPRKGSLPKLDGACSIRQVEQTKDTLSGKTVSVVGLVSKINRNIMGKNWIHLLGEEGHELVVTTQDDASPGTVVLVKGTVTNNKTFNTGYFIPLVLENSELRSLSSRAGKQRSSSK